MYFCKPERNRLNVIKQVKEMTRTFLHKFYQSDADEDENCNIKL